LALVFRVARNFPSGSVVATRGVKKERVGPGGGVGAARARRKCRPTYGGVAVAGVGECGHCPEGGVIEAYGVLVESVPPGGCIFSPRGVVVQRLRTKGGVTEGINAEATSIVV